MYLDRLFAKYLTWRLWPNTEQIFRLTVDQRFFIGYVMALKYLLYFRDCISQDLMLNDNKPAPLIVFRHLAKLM